MFRDPKKNNFIIAEKYTVSFDNQSVKTSSKEMFGNIKFQKFLNVKTLKNFCFKAKIIVEKILDCLPILWSNNHL